MIHLLLAITITRHVVNDIVGLHIGGLAPTTNVIHWQALSGNPSGGENIDLNGSRYHQEVPLQCTDDVFVTPDATHEECDQLLYHTEAP